MSETEETLHRHLREKEVVAQMYAKRGDNSKMVTLLRELYRAEEIPDLSFIADLLELKKKKPVGRPSDEKIVSGLNELQAAQTVHKLITEQGLAVEVAVEEAADRLQMSESTIKKHYFKCRKNGLLSKPVKAKIPSGERSFK